MPEIFRTNPLFYSGEDSRSILPELIKPKGRRAAVVTGAETLARAGLKDALAENLRNAGIDATFHPVSGEPAPALVDGLAAGAVDAEVIAAVGGGSVIDAGKALSALLAERRNAGKTFSVKELLEGVGRRPPRGVKLPFIALPTTAGTGSEGSFNAVLSEPGPAGYKKSLRHPALMPDAVILDPVLAAGCPPQQTAFSGLDAISQLIEAYLSREAGPHCELLALNGLELAFRALPALMTGSRERSLWSDMQRAAYYSGLSLANAGLGPVHGLAGPLGGLIKAPHGALCGALLPSFLQSVVEGGLDRTGGAEVAEKLDRCSARLGARGNRHSRITALVSTLEEWRRKYGIPALAHWGVTPDLAALCADKGSSKNFPFPLSREERLGILERAL